MCTDNIPELPKLPHGQGTLRYQKDRKLIRYTKRIQGTYVSVYGNTVKECFSKMKSKERDLEEKVKMQHPTDTPAQVLLQEAIYRWLFTYKKPMLKDRSFDTIEGTYHNQIEDTFLGRTCIDQVQSDDVQLYLNELIESKSLSTTKKAFSLLKQFFDYYYARDINNNPMNLVNLPKKQVRYNSDIPIEDKDNLIVLSDDEIEKLTHELEKPYSNGKIGYFYGNALLFIMWTFMRIGEVIALQYKDIDFEQNTIKVYKSYERVKDRTKETKNNYKWELSDTKTQSGRRIIYMCDEAAKYLKRHITEHYPDPQPETFIFFSTQGNPLAPQFLNNILIKALKRSGVKKHVSVHGLRHTGISYFIRHGVSIKVISKMAGHSDVATTDKIYYNVIQEQLRNAFKNERLTE